MKKIIMATNNKGKIEELKKMLSKYEILSNIILISKVTFSILSTSVFTLKKERGLILASEEKKEKECSSQSGGYHSCYCSPRNGRSFPCRYIDV